MVNLKMQTPHVLTAIYIEPVNNTTITYDITVPGSDVTFFYYFE